jgi:citrate lyase subunit beta/citryl-CoA lyase
MSAATPAERGGRPRRSVLIVPASSTRMLEKARQLDADEVVLDLEDSVTPEAKAAARRNGVEMLGGVGWGPGIRSVRINDATAPYTLRDMLEVVAGAAGHLDTVLLPKVRSAAQVHAVAWVLGQLEMELGLPAGGIGLGVQLEDAHGLERIQEILDASPRIETITFGPGDLAASLGMRTLAVGGAQPDYPGDQWHWVEFTLLVHARTRGIQVIDGPYGKVHDTEGFESLARRSRALGFDGKWVLHPSQIAPANEIYGVSLVEYERARDLLEAYAAAGEEQHRGAVLFGEEMIDEANRHLAEITVRKGEAQGLEVRGTPPEVPHHERADWREGRRGSNEDRSTR